MDGYELIFLFSVFVISLVVSFASRSCLLIGGAPEISRWQTRTRTEGHENQKVRSKGVLAALVQGYHIPRRIIR